ncbi:paraquat-inducible protein A [Neptunomonas qingdaonensis]|uniref:Paraquat-inducible protein A n=1 Tax=Neptunomonas qingdaonensis TaxID=1045558 RepID=A0A1I2U716_9GAMM|nr:paraquat-inducible protein A [Neptunomonas qingdaonensis]SFG72813.1 paraquat-inducible protein A [Neptunomonas qingdaonensis]
MKQHSALTQGIILCHCCKKPAPIQDDKTTCPRCGTRLHRRKPHSIAYTWALLLASMIMLLPANLLPIMTFRSLGQGDPATIMQGVMQLLDHGLLGIAFVVLAASIIIPILKIVGLIILLLTVQLGWTTNMRQKMLMYHFVEWIGRWSMLDIFVVAILAAIVQLGNLASVTGNTGATAFAAAVIFTMLAANCFDTRLIWDKHLEQLEVFP